MSNEATIQFMTRIDVTIDDNPSRSAEGTTIMEAAEQLGIRIPRLCYHPDLSLAGSCRVCVVDVKDMGYYMAACSVQVWEGMEVQTNSPEIRQARRDIVELLLDNHHMDCQTCERDGNCELQNLAYAMGVRQPALRGRAQAVPHRGLQPFRGPRSGEVHPLRPLRAGVRRDPGRLQPQPARPRLPHRGGARPPGQDGRFGLHPVRAVHQRLPHGGVPGKAHSEACGTRWPIPRCTS